MRPFANTVAALAVFQELNLCFPVALIVCFSNLPLQRLQILALSPAAPQVAALVVCLFPKSCPSFGRTSVRVSPCTLHVSVTDPSAVQVASLREVSSHLHSPCDTLTVTFSAVAWMCT